MCAKLVLFLFYTCFFFEGASLLLCNFVRVLLLLLLFVQRRHGRRRRRRRRGDRHCRYFFFFNVCIVIFSALVPALGTTRDKEEVMPISFFFFYNRTPSNVFFDNKVLFLFVLWDTNSAFRRKKALPFSSFLFLSRCIVDGFLFFSVLGIQLVFLKPLQK